ncbi:MAG: hypothetical protein GVY05_06670, partial [Bacteroidetes bacterium]|nr:hypothetical protein [Bacteroidota bacterium]
MPSPFFYEKQNTTLVWVVCIIVFVIITVLGFYGEDITSDEGDKMPAIFIYINLTIIIAAFLLFYNMKIVLDDKYLIIKFGIGVFKKKFKLEDVDSSSLKIYKPSMWYGIGWRYNLKGDMLFNTKFGTAVRFKLKNKSKSYSVVTSNYEEL